MFRKGRRRLGRKITKTKKISHFGYFVWAILVFYSRHCFRLLKFILFYPSTPCSVGPELSYDISLARSVLSPNSISPYNRVGAQADSSQANITRKCLAALAIRYRRLALATSACLCKCIPPPTSLFVYFFSSLDS